MVHEHSSAAMAWLAVGFAMGMGMGLGEPAALGEPPMASAKALHGTGPFGLMRAVDMDRDGRKELLVEDGRGRLVLIEPTRRTDRAGIDRVVSLAFNDIREIVAGDLDRDGDMEVVSAGDDAIRWHQSVVSDDISGGGQTAGGWETHELATSPGARAVALGDFDGDGDLDCLAPDATGLNLVWYRNDTPNEAVEFVADLTIALNAPAIGLVAVDVNRDGWLDALSLSSRGLGVHLRDPDLGSFTSIFVDTGLGDPRHFVAHDADGDGDLDVLLVGDDKVLIATNADGSGGDWLLGVIAEDLDLPRRGYVTDLDTDGAVDYMIEGGGQSAVWIPDMSGVGSVAYRVALRTYGPIAMFDFDGDGDEDLIGVIAAGTLLWRENLLIHRSDALPRRSDVEIEVDGAYNLASGDLDGDGDIDLVSAAFTADTVAWHENLGGGVFLSHPVFENTNGPVAVVCADFDLDGLLDIASASTNDDTIHWHRNLGGLPPTFETSLVSADADGVFSISVGDLDRDGRLDIVSAEKNTDRVRWFRNQDVNGEVEFTSGLVKGGVEAAFSVHVADMDGDGWPDVLSASRDDASIRLLRNLGGDPLSFQTIVLTNGADRAVSVYAADLDGDGDLDVASASRRDSTIRWFENDGASPPAFIERAVDRAAIGATWVRAADLDHDGDIDLVAAARDSGLVHVYTNNGASPPSFAKRALGEAANRVSCVEPADLDGDGRVDLAIAAVNDDLLAWYRNEGGMFAFAVSSIAPESIPAWGVGGLLKINAVSRAHNGDGDILLERITLRFEDESGAALTTDQLALLVQRLALHLDTGVDGDNPDGIFDPLVDEEIVALATITLDAGEVVIEIPQIAMSFAPGVRRTFFVAVRMAQNAGNQDLTSFGVVLTEFDAVDAHNASSVTIEDGRVVGTPIVSATCPADMTTSDDPSDPDFGKPDGVVNQIDFLYYHRMYQAADPSADFTSVEDRTDPAYGIPDGIVDPLDLTYFLERFDEGC